MYAATLGLLTFSVYQVSKIALHLVNCTSKAQSYFTKLFK